MALRCIHHCFPQGHPRWLWTLCPRMLHSAWRRHSREEWRATHAYLLRMKRPMSAAGPGKAAVATTRDDLAGGGLGRSARNSVYDTRVARVRSSCSCRCVWSAASCCGCRRANWLSSLRTWFASRRETRSSAVGNVFTGLVASSRCGAESAQGGPVHPVHRVPEESPNQEGRHLRRVKAHRVLGAKYQAATTSFCPLWGHAIEKAHTDTVSEQRCNAGDGDEACPVADPSSRPVRVASAGWSRVQGACGLVASMDCACAYAQHGKSCGGAGRGDRCSVRGRRVDCLQSRAGYGRAA